MHDDWYNTYSPECDLFHVSHEDMQALWKEITRILSPMFHYFAQHLHIND